MESKPNNGNTKSSGKLSGVIVFIVLILLLGGLFRSCGSTDSSSDLSSKGEVRCWYCSKVIYNNGRPIHCTHDYNSVYTCDYCGKNNVIK